MALTQQRDAAPRSAGPFVTASGRRLPIRSLSTADKAGLLEFGDYLARATPAPLIVGLDRAGIEALSESDDSMVGVMMGPRQLVRAVGLCQQRSPRSADVRFTVDASAAADGVFRELVLRVADAARQRGIHEFRMHASPGSDDVTAVESAGFSFRPVDATADELIIDIAEPR